MRIVFLAVDDEFAGELQRVVYESHPEWIVGSVISSRLIYKKSRFGGALMVLRKSGWTFLAAMIYVKMIRRVMDRGRRVLPSTLARDHGVEQFRCGNINSEDSVQRLRSWRPDLVISTNFSHYIGRTVRDSVARYGCWNLHKALLPRYRGMSPSFYALLEGAPTAGATLHVVSQQLDGGDILAQVEVPVSTTDSVYSLNRKASRAGGRLLASFLGSYDPRVTQGVAQPQGVWKQYSYPSSGEVRAFRQKGLRFYSPGDD